MSLSAKDRAQRRLESNRSGGLNYEPHSSASTHAAFRDSPILYYSVFDSNLAPVRKDVVYAHSLEELHYMAIDNASRLETFDLLFRIRHDFSPRNMTVRDLILTAFVGTSDGKLNTMLVCPYQGDSPYAPDTSLYAVVMSELLPNTRQTPLRIALNVPASMKKWSHMPKLRMFGGSVDSKLIELNNRVNCFQVVELRNDPDGSVRYSQRVLDEIEKAKNPPVEKSQPVVPEGTTALSNGAAAGTALDNSAAETVDMTVQAEETEADESDAQEVTPADNSGNQADQAPSTLAERQLSSERAPIATVTDEPPVIDSTIDVSTISGPLQAAQLEDNTTVELDDTAIEAAESNPAFSTRKTVTHDVNDSSSSRRENVLQEASPDATRDRPDA